MQVTNRCIGHLIQQLYLLSQKYAQPQRALNQGVRWQERFTKLQCPLLPDSRHSNDVTIVTVKNLWPLLPAWDANDA